MCIADLTTLDDVIRRTRKKNKRTSCKILITNSLGILAILLITLIQSYHRRQQYENMQRASSDEGLLCTVRRWNAAQNTPLCHELIMKFSKFKTRGDTILLVSTGTYSRQGKIEIAHSFQLSKRPPRKVAIILMVIK